MGSKNIGPYESNRTSNNTYPKVLKDTESRSGIFRKAVVTTKAPRIALKEVITGAKDLGKSTRGVASESLEISQEAITRAEEIGESAEEVAKVAARVF